MYHRRTCFVPYVFYNSLSVACRRGLVPGPPVPIIHSDVSIGFISFFIDFVAIASNHIHENDLFP